MACCAFAVFLLVNLLAPFEVVRGRLLGGAPRRDGAASWRLGTAGTMQAPVGPRGHWRATAGAIAAVELALVVGAGAYLLAADTNARAGDEAQWDALVALHTVWCSDASSRPDTPIQIVEPGP